MVDYTFAQDTARELAPTKKDREYAFTLINHIAERMFLDEQGFLIWLNTIHPAIQMKPRDAVKTYGLGALERIMYAHKAPIASLQGPDQFTLICKFLDLPPELTYQHSEIVFDGFDTTTIQHLADTTNLSVEEILAISSITEATVNTHQHRGTRLTPQESNRLYHTAAALAAVYALHPNPVDVPKWLRYTEFSDDTTPMYYLSTDAGVMWLIDHMIHKFRPDIP